MCIATQGYCVITNVNKPFEQKHITENLFGFTYPSFPCTQTSVAMSYGNMGYVYRSLGKAEEAREMFTKTYSIFLKVLGPDHPHTQQAKSAVD